MCQGCNEWHPQTLILNNLISNIRQHILASTTSLSKNETVIISDKYQISDTGLFVPCLFCSTPVPSETNKEETKTVQMETCFSHNRTTITKITNAHSTLTSSSLNLLSSILIFSFLTQHIFINLHYHSTGGQPPILSGLNLSHSF